MNQILDYNSNRNYNDDNNYNDQGGDNKNKIIKVFAIILIIFAIILIGIGIYNKFFNIPGVEESDQNNKDAIINTEQSGNKLLIKIEHDKEIKKLIYNWNTNTEKTVSVDTGKTFETTIDIPAGENSLNIKVIDVDEHPTFITKTIQAEEGVDIIKPEIKLESTEDKKLRIIATDETELDFLTYRWNDEEEVTVKPKDVNPKKIQVDIDIKSGENSLMISAVDKKNNNESISKVFDGLLQPNIEVQAEENKLKIKCSHENGIAKIEYTLNDNPYEATLEDSPKVVEFDQALEEGNNIIILKVTSVDGTESNFAGQCSYKADTSNVDVEE